MWVVFAILSAVFAALTSILAKIGITGVLDKIPMSQFPEDLILQYEKMTGLSYSSFTGICWC